METMPPEFAHWLDEDSLQPKLVRFLGENDVVTIWVGVDAENFICVFYDMLQDQGSGGSMCLPTELFAEHGSHGGFTRNDGGHLLNQGFFLAPEGYVLDEVPRGLEKILDNFYAGDFSQLDTPVRFYNKATGREIAFMQ
ncbi:hypothetical protein [Glutamicibacter sp. X7]